MPLSNQAKTIKLHKGQTKAWESNARFLAMICGTGGGKTFFGPYWLYREISRNPTANFMVVAPTYKILSRATVPEMLKAFSGTDVEGQYNKTEGIYKLPQGGTIYCVSADKPNYLEGGQIMAAWMDEAGQMGRWAWVVIQARLGVSQGRCLITTTPYSMNWLYKEFYKRWEHKDSDYEVIQFESIENPVYSVKEYERMKEMLTPEEFAMRYKGEFRELSGLVYPLFHTCVTQDADYRVTERDIYVGGIDPGWSAPFAVLDAILQADGKVRIINEIYETTKLIREIAPRLLRGATYWVDPAAKREREELEAAPGSFTVQPADNDIRIGIMKVNQYIRDKRLIVPEEICPNLISEASMYSWSAEDEPNKKTEHHLLDALRYLIMGIEQDSKVNVYFV